MVASVVPLAESLASTLPFHSILFAFYPVVRLYGENANEVELADVVAPVALLLAVTLAGLLLLSRLLRDPRRAGIIVSAIVLVVLMSGLVAEVLAPTFGDVRSLLLLAGVGLVVVAMLVAWRAGPRLGPITLGLNVISLVMVLLALVPAAQGLAAGIRDEAEDSGRTVTGQAAAGAPTRDIYHLVLDRYGSEASLAAGLAIDNEEFISWLRDNGFHVVDDAHANYTKTTLSLGATLGMSLLDTISEKMGPRAENLAPVVRRIMHSKAGEFLQGQGYEYIHIGSWFNQSRDSKIADRSYSPETEVSFGSTLYDQSILPVLVQRPSATSDFARKHANSALYQFKLLDALADEPGRKYVFAHILLPHDPYVFLEDGTYDSDSATYETQLAFTNRRVRQFIEPLLALPEMERPIIILQGDEGPYPDRFRADQDGFDWSTATDDEIVTKFGILDAMYLPGPEGETPLRKDLTAVNTYPELFRRYFGADLPDEPDRVLASNRARPYDLLDITDRLESIEQDGEAG